MERKTERKKKMKKAQKKNIQRLNENGRKSTISNINDIGGRDEITANKVEWKNFVKFLRLEDNLFACVM